MAVQPPQDESFELYDLRVEVVCPPGKRIMCGAKEGDYFTLEGEMLRLPSDQGISIYSLCESAAPRLAESLGILQTNLCVRMHVDSICAAAFACETARHVQKRLDDD